MNIFVTDKSPKISAYALDDKRVVKMILESAQLLSAAVFIHTNIAHQNLYRPTHLKHPCTIWTAECRGNCDWVMEHFIALGDEYNFRYDKKHKSLTLLPYLKDSRIYIPEGDRTPFANCTNSEAMNVNFKDMEDTEEAYRQYMNVKWQRDKKAPKWTRRGAPIWYKIAD